MCTRDHNIARRGSKKIEPQKEDPLKEHFGTSMLFTKSMKSL